MNPQPSPPRLDQVAARAGVSTATVSRYFNSPNLLAPATAEKIRTAVSELGYVPNLIAGGIKTRRTGLVAVLVPDLSQSIFNDTIDAMVSELSDHGMSAMLGITGYQHDRTPLLIEAALARRANAVILTAVVSDDEIRQKLRHHQTTVIETWGLPSEPINFAVGFSHHAAGEAIARFLFERGYRRPHLVVPDSPRAVARRDGFVSAWLSAGGDTPTEFPVTVPSRFGHGRAAFRRIGDLDPRPDVAVCGSDLLAQGMIVEALHAGVRIPDDLAVFGFGNMSLAGDMRPTISTVDIDGARIGRETVALLREQASGAGPMRRTVDVGFRIVARESA